MENLVLICCLHGNEGFGLEVCKSQSLFPFFVGNERALKENRRFIDVDLNRCFPGNKQGKSEETSLSFWKIAKRQFQNTKVGLTKNHLGF
jgi:succinylglutamate desuccinylase